MAMTTADAARQLGLSDGRIRQLARAGVILGDRMGRDWILDDASVAAYRRRRRPKRTDT